MPKIDLNRIGILRCPSCDKVCYTSIQDARLAAKTLTDVSTNKYNAYLCSSCGYYHIGHLSVKDTHEDDKWWKEYQDNLKYYRI